jgi:hypothetical protein
LIGQGFLRHFASAPFFLADFFIACEEGDLFDALRFVSTVPWFPAPSAKVA